MSDRLDPAAVRLTVNPITCDGRGLCAELLPEWISLDDWGYPIIGAQPTAEVSDQTVRRAIAACPTLALRLEPVNSSRANPSGPIFGAKG
jgi:ferredoxin